jgi:hypothetical protein
MLAWVMPLFAQNTWQAGVLPTLNLSTSISGDWKLNFKAESRQVFFYGSAGENTVYDYRYILTDLSAVTSKKVGLNNSLAGGYQVRSRDNTFYHRLIQQFTLVNQYGFFRIGHRFSSDQTFSSKESAEIRFRYRIATDIPLNGQSVDPGEMYFKFSNEYLYSLQDKESDLEVRIIPLLGYEFTDNNKLEWGLDYRVSSFLDGNRRSAFWLSLNWLISI